MVNAYSTCLQCWRLIRNYDYIWRGIAYVWYPTTFPATSNIHKLNYVTGTISWSCVQLSLLGEAHRTERAVEIEPTKGGGGSFFEMLKQNLFANIACPASFSSFCVFSLFYLILFFRQNKIRRGRAPALDPSLSEMH